jgi:hypothetical protein
MELMSRLGPMKYREIVADKLSAAGWSCGYCSAVKSSSVMPCTAHSARMTAPSSVVNKEVEHFTYA